LPPLLTFSLVYLLPACILIGMAIEVIRRGPLNLNHWLAAAVILSFSGMMIEEYARQLYPIRYSEWFVTFWLGNIGVIAIAFALHFHFRITRKYHAIPAKWYLPFCYSALLVIIPTFFKLDPYNSTHYFRIGIWIYPVYNAHFRTSTSLLAIFAFLNAGLLINAYSKSQSKVERSQFLYLLFGISFLTASLLFGATLPAYDTKLYPFPYLFIDIIWVVFLAGAVLRHGLFPSIGRKYVALFNLNPLPVLIIDEQFNIHERNFAARRLLVHTADHLEHILPAQEVTRVCTFITEQRKQMLLWTRFQTQIVRPEGQPIAALLTGDFLEINGETHCMLIIMNAD